MHDIKSIIEALRRTGDKDSKVYKVTKYYMNLTSGLLDEGGVVFASSKLKNIEKELKKWILEHPNNGTAIMQPEESALMLIEDLRKRYLIK